MDALGQAIRNARKSRGWTQQDLVEYISAETNRDEVYSQTVASRWELRDTQIPEDALRVLVKWGIGINLTEARRLNRTREREHDPREKLARLEYEVMVLNQKLDKILDAVNAS